MRGGGGRGVCKSDSTIVPYTYVFFGSSSGLAARVTVARESFGRRLRLRQNINHYRRLTANKVYSNYSTFKYKLDAIRSCKIKQILER